MRRLLTAFTLPVLVLLGLVVWQLGWLAGPDKLPARVSEYHKVYDGFWDVACDSALDGTDRRCYIQYVDVYRPRPDFAAAMVEVVMHEGPGAQPDPHIRFDLEPGLSFLDATIAIEGPSGPLAVDVSHCAVNTCPISGDAARGILAQMLEADALTLRINEGRSEITQLSWPLETFPVLFDDFAARRAERDLP